MGKALDHGEHGKKSNHRRGPKMYEFVTPANAGVQEVNHGRYWIPAFAGMTETLDFIGLDQ
jgi:hypothetical protein